MPAPDTHISHAAALTYWSSTPATVDGMLGGYPHISATDLAGSHAFLARLASRHPAPAKTAPPAPAKGAVWFERAVDCGAGIGRITAGLLARVAGAVDVVEPVAKFTQEIETGEGCRAVREAGRLGEVYTQGLQAWVPARGYDLVWNQWVLGQLTDAQLVGHLERCGRAVNRGGWVVVKENIASDEEDVFDDVDSSVTRSEGKLRAIFARAKLRVVESEVQKGFPKGLFKVMTFALRPVDWD